MTLDIDYQLISLTGSKNVMKVAQHTSTSCTCILYDIESIKNLLCNIFLQKSFQLFYDSFFFCIFNRNRKTCFGSTQDILELRTWFQLMHHYDTINGIYKIIHVKDSQIYFIIFLIKWKYSWNENQEMLLIYG